ncbi:hypothetical protein ABZ297_46300, partial [Nonomuraea sp. NPDC005983]
PGGAFQRGAFRRPPDGFRQPGGVRGPGADGGLRGTGGRPGGMGRLLEAGTPGAELTALLEGGASGYTWVAATVGSNNAAGYQLATGSPVMAVGGFNGTDPAPTLEQFQRYVAEKKIHYFIGAGMGGGRGTGGGTGASGGTGGSGVSGVSGGSDEAARIASWVGSSFTAATVAGVTVYDLTH